MANKIFSILEYVKHTGTIGGVYDIAGLDKIRFVVEGADGSNVFSMSVRVKGQQSFTVMATLTGNVNRVVDVRSYDELRIQCTTFDPTANQVTLIGSGFKLGTSPVFEYANFASFPTASGSGDLAWDADTQTLYYDEVTTQSWVASSGGGGGGGTYNVESPRTLLAGDITAKQITLSGTPTNANRTRLQVIGGVSQLYGTDFTVSGTTLSWNGLALDGVLEAGDVLLVEYN